MNDDVLKLSDLVRTPRAINWTMTSEDQIKDGVEMYDNIYFCLE